MPVVKGVSSGQAAGAAVGPAVLLECPDVVVDVQRVVRKPWLRFGVRVVNAAKDVGRQWAVKKWIDATGLVAFHRGERQVRPSEGKSAGERKGKDEPLHRPSSLFPPLRGPNGLPKRRN